MAESATNIKIKNSWIDSCSIIQLKIKNDTWIILLKIDGKHQKKKKKM